MNRKQLLLVAQRPGIPLGPPPESLDESVRSAWADIVAAVPGDVFRAQDALILAHVARCLAAWRAGTLSGPVWTRHLYRRLGDYLVPMAARRRLLFPDAKPSRSRWV